MEDGSTGSEAQDPRGFAPEDLRNIAEQNTQLQADKAFLRQQMASMQSSVDLLLSKFPQQVTESASAPNETSKPWIVDGDILIAPPFRSTQRPQQQQSPVQTGPASILHPTGGQPVGSMNPSQSDKGKGPMFFLYQQQEFRQGQPNQLFQTFQNDKGRSFVSFGQQQQQQQETRPAQPNQLFRREQPNQLFQQGSTSTDPLVNKDNGAS